MIRDLKIFPEDENGDALWNMALQGDDLSKPREINFSVLFSTENNALEFGEVLLFNRQKVSLSDCEDDPEYPFEITVHHYIEATHSGITEYENLLQEYAEKYNGYNDGWGAMHNQKASNKLYHQNKFSLLASLQLPAVHGVRSMMNYIMM